MQITMNPNSELNQSAVNVPEVVQVPERLIAEAKRFQEAMMMYTCAIREIKTKLEVLNDELSVRNQRNPIEMIKSRVKKPSSIVEKLQRRNLEVSVDSMMANLDDIAGIRVICSFVDDIYAVSEMLTGQDDIKVIAIKDYIKNPKKNGYKSLLLIVKVPIYSAEGEQKELVEIQLRTIAMDYWSVLEYELYYKKRDNAEIETELKKYAEEIANLDHRMLGLRNKIEKI